MLRVMIIDITSSCSSRRDAPNEGPTESIADRWRSPVDHARCIPAVVQLGNMCSVPFTFTIAPSSTPMPMPSSGNRTGGVTVEDGVDATADGA